MTIDRNAVRARLEAIADTLELPHVEVDRAMADDDATIDFAARHNQSLDWIFLGDLRVMIARLAAEAGGAS